MEDVSFFDGKEELVENATDVIFNINRFNKDLGKSEYLLNNLSHYKDWYFDSVSKQFGPKKFVGFKNMTAAKYVALKIDPRTNIRSNFDSSLTASILKKLSVKADEYECNGSDLFVELEMFLANYHAHPRRDSAVHIIR